MYKILTILFIVTSLIILMASIRNAYKVRQSILSLKNRKIYNFILVNIGIALFFLVYYFIFLAVAFFEHFDTGNLLASFLFLMNSVYVYVSSIVTQDVGALLFRLDSVRKMDSLTNIYNRLNIEKAIKKEFERCMRFNHNASLLMIDINNFKDINDKFGHQAGDKVILDLVRTMKVASRTVDTLGRYGGDEFIILMPETNIHEARSLSHRLCEMVANRIIHTHGHKIAYDISIGISDVSTDYIDYEDWMHVADIDLYNDKRLKAS